MTHDDFVTDSLAVARSIYAHFGMPLSDEVGAALASHVAANPQGKHGLHKYERKDFYLSDAEMLDRFADYLEFFEMTPR